MTTKLFTLHTDPSQSWLEVTMDDLMAVYLTPEHFSTCSYRSWDGKTMWLDADCDAPRFTLAWKAKQGDLNVTEAHTDHKSPIRKLLRNSVKELA